MVIHGHSTKHRLGFDTILINFVFLGMVKIQWSKVGAKGRLRGLGRKNFVRNGLPKSSNENRWSCCSWWNHFWHIYYWLPCSSPRNVAFLRIIEASNVHSLCVTFSCSNPRTSWNWMQLNCNTPFQESFPRCCNVGKPQKWHGPTCAICESPTQLEQRYVPPLPGQETAAFWASHTAKWKLLFLRPGTGPTWSWVLRPKERLWKHVSFCRSETNFDFHKTIGNSVAQLQRPMWCFIHLQSRPPRKFDEKPEWHRDVFPSV